jgi:hypothetical protein
MSQKLVKQDRQTICLLRRDSGQPCAKKAGTKDTQLNTVTHIALDSSKITTLLQQVKSQSVISRIARSIFPSERLINLASHMLATIVTRLVAHEAVQNEYDRYIRTAPIGNRSWFHPEYPSSGDLRNHYLTFIVRPILVRPKPSPAENHLIQQVMSPGGF